MLGAIRSGELARREPMGVVSAAGVSMRRMHWVILVLLTGLGLGLRLYGLSGESLYNDELYSWYQVHFETFGEVMAKGIRPDAYPPGYLILLYGWIRAFGDSEAMLRLPSALAGTLWIPVIFLLGWKLFGHEEGLIAAGLVAVARTPVYFSQEVRAYAFLILFVMLAAYCWTGVVRDRRTWPAVGYALCAAVALYLHPFGMVFVGLAGAAMFLACLRDRRTLIVCSLMHLAVLVLYLPWLPEFLRDIGAYESFLKPPGLRHVGRLFSYLFNQSNLLMAIAVVFYGGLAYRAATKGITRTEIMLVVWAVVPVVVIFVKSVVSDPIWTNRNLLICLPPVYLLLARAIAVTPVRRRWRGAVAGVVVGVFLAQLVFVSRYYTPPHKTQFREAVRFIVDRERDHPDAPVVGLAWFPELIDYYFVKFGSRTRVSVMGGYEPDLPAIRSFLEQRRPRYVWYIYAHRMPSEAFLRFFGDGERFRLIEEGRFIKAGVSLFEVRGPASRSRPASARPKTRPGSSAGP